MRNTLLGSGGGGVCISGIWQVVRADSLFCADIHTLFYYIQLGVRTKSDEKDRY
jgi:hypothetical protein